MAEKDTKKKLKIAKIRIKKRHPIVRMLFIVGFVFIVAEVILLFFATPILRQSLGTFIDTKSEGLYEIDFDSLSVDLGGRSFVFFGLRLKPDTAVYNKFKDEQKAKRALYELHFNTFKISNLRIFKLYNKKQLDFNQLIIESPDIKLVGLPFKAKKGDKKYQAVQEDLYPALLDILGYLKVKKIKILNGNFNFWINEGQEEETSVAENISFELHDFYLDAKTYLSSKNLLYAQRTLIEINNYKLKLNDSIHVLKAKQIKVDTKQKIMRAFDIQIYPGQLSPQDVIKQSKSFSDIELPMLQVSGLDINKALKNKEIELSGLYLKEPSIYLYNDNKSKKNSKIDYNLNFYPLIDGILKSIKINEFILEKAQFYVHNKDVPKPVVSLPVLNVRFYDFLLSKDSYKKLNRIFGAKDIDIDARSLKLSIPKSKSSFQLQKLNLSTVTNKLVIRNLNISSHLKQAGKKKMDIKIPLLSMSNLNLLKLVHKKYLPIGKLSLKGAKFDVFFEKGNKKSNKLKGQTWKEIVLYYFQQLRIREFEISNLGLAFSQKIGEDTTHLESNIDFRIHNLRLTPQLIKQPDKFFYSDSLSLVLSKFKMGKKSKIVFDSLFASSSDSILWFSGLELLPDKENEEMQLNFKLPRLAIHRADFNKTLFNRHLFLDSIVIFKPEVKLILSKSDSLPDVLVDSLSEVLVDTLNIKETFDQKLKAIKELALTENGVLMRDLPLFKELSHWIDTATIRSVNLLRGNLSLVQKGTQKKVGVSFQNDISAQLSNFYFHMDMNLDSAMRSKKLFFSDSMRVDLYNYTLNLPDDIHYLKVEKLSVNSVTKSIALNNIVIKPDKQKLLEKGSEKWMDIEFPKIEISDINFHDFFFQRKIIADTIFVNSGKIISYTGRDSLDRTRRKQFNSSAIKLPKNFDLLSVAHIILDTTQLFVRSNDSLYNFVTVNLNAELQDFKLDSVYQQRKEYNFPARDIAIHVDNLNIVFPDSIQRLKIKDLHYSSESQSLSINDLLVYYKIDTSEAVYLRQHNRPSLVQISIPSYSADGIDFNQLLKRKLIIEASEANFPVIRAYSLQDSSLADMSKSNWFLKIYPYFDRLNLEEIDFYGAEINTNQILYNDSVKNLQLFMSGTAYDFNIDTVDQIKIPKYFYREKANVTLHDFKLYTQAKSYLLNIPAINADTRDSTVTIRNLSYKPTAIPQDFIHRDSTSYIAIDSVFFKAKGVDFNKFFERKYISMSSAVLVNLNLNIISDDNYLPEESSDGQMLMGLLEAFPYKLAIKNLAIEDGNVYYALTAENATIPGIIEFSRLNGKIDRLTNYSRMYPFWNTMLADINLYMYDKSHINLKLSTELTKKDDEFKLYIGVNDFEFSDLNRFLVETYYFSIKSGFSDNTRLFIEGNNKEIKGSIRMRYKNLKISILKSKNENLKKRGLTSYLANTVIRKNNPRRGSFILKEGTVFLIRDSSSMFITYWIDGLLEGVKSTLGFRSKDVKKYDKLKRVLKKAKEKALKLEQKSKTSSMDLPKSEMPEKNSGYLKSMFILDYRERQFSTLLNV